MQLRFPEPGTEAIPTDQTIATADGHSSVNLADALVALFLARSSDLS